MAELLVHSIEAEAYFVFSEPRVRQLSKVKYLGFVGYFGFEEFVDRQIVGGMKKYVILSI